MSKCNIDIEFDRADRTYRGGETVAGTVRIRVNEDINSNGIKLTHFWKTHGRGNTDNGGKHEQLLAESGPLRDGETLEFPFSFVAECLPLTYHGHYINIDHYVRVDVDVPWAFDPKLEEEYILLPGRRPPQMTGRRDEIIEFKKDSTEVTSAGGKFVVFLIVGVLLVVFSVFAIMLVPLLVVGGALYWIWKKAIEGRVGDVRVKAHHLVVAPCEAWPLELAFTPRKSFQVNGITVKIQGREAATSGSGTNKTTHHHTIFEEVHTLHPAGVISAGEPISKQVHIALPTTDAFSFDAGDNEIQWSAEVRIDMPLFPDWKERKVLQFVPAEFLQEVEAAPVSEPIFEPAPPAPQPVPVQFDRPAEQPAETPQPAVEIPQAAKPAPSIPVLPSIAPLLAEIANASRYGSERRDIATAAQGRVFDVAVEIDQLVSTFGSQAGAGYHNGKTITGKVAGTDHTVQIFTRDASNLRIERLNRGDRWSTPAAVYGWDSLYDRLVLIESDGTES